MMEFLKKHKATIRICVATNAQEIGVLAEAEALGFRVYSREILAVESGHQFPVYQADLDGCQLRLLGAYMVKEPADG